MTKFRSIPLFVLFLTLYALIDRYCFTDFSGHTKILFDFLEHGSFPSPPLYFAVLYVCGEFFSWGLSLATHLTGAAPGPETIHASGYAVAVYFLMACFTVFKFLVAETVFRHIVERKNVTVHEQRRIGILVLLLLFAHPVSLFFRHMYLGFAAVNVWHNSSTIMMVPFAVWLFFLTRQWLTRPEASITTAVPVVIVAIVNILIKPSYCFVYVVVLPVIAFLTYRFSARFYHSLLITAVIALGILIQYILLYHVATDFETCGYTGTNSKVIISPFTVWFFYAGYVIPLNLLFSILFPLCVLWTYGRKVICDTGYQFAWLSFIVALLIFICVAESGPRLYHANFSWQLVPCTFILFLYSLALLYKHQGSGVSKFKYRLSQIAFCAHVLCGFVYVGRMILFHQYV